MFAGAVVAAAIVAAAGVRAHGRALDSASPGAAPWSALKLQQMINRSIEAGASSLVVPGGDYVFANTSLVLAGARGFELRTASAGVGGAALPPARMWFDIGHGFLVE